MADLAIGRVAVPARDAARPRHSAVVRVTHWLTAISFLALLVTGVEILLAHPRFYWGEVGNVGTTPLFQLPVPSSRAMVPTRYDFVLPDQNGWSRNLHFQSAWLVVLSGLLYAAYGFWSGHFRKDLLPARAALSAQSPYNPVQRFAYLFVIFILFPVMILTGLAMSLGFTSAVPLVAKIWGGQQSARTIHFFATLLLVAFLLVHITMVALSGFRDRMRGMIIGAGEQR